MEITCFLLQADGVVRSGLSFAEAVEARGRAGGVVWIDFLSPTEEDRHSFQELGLHRVAIDACVEPGQHPVRVEQFDDHLFLLLHGVDYEAESTVVETSELALFVGSGFLVTSHRSPLFSVNAVMRRLLDSPGELPHDPGYLAYTLADGLVDNVMPMIDALRDLAEELENAIIESPRQGHIESILDLKHSTLRLGRVLAPQFVVLDHVSDYEGTEVGDEAALGFRHVRDQVRLIESLLATTRERADSAMATYMSAVAIKQNESVRTLTLVAFVFLPLTLLVGIYGMNFQNMPETESEYGYFVVLGVVIVALAGMVAWLTASRVRAVGRNAAARARNIQVDRRKLVGYIGDLGHAATGAVRTGVRFPRSDQGEDPPQT